MKKHITRTFCTIVAVIAMVAMMQSCATKEKALSQLRDLSSEIQYNGVNYTVGEWQNVAEKYWKLNKKVAKYKLTAEESREVGELNGKCLGYFVSGVGANVLGRVGNAAKGINGLLEGLKESLQMK